MLFICYVTLIILYIIFNPIQIVVSNNDTDKVVFVSVLYKYGEMVPFKTYPKDKYNKLSYWPTSWGQLTNIGKQQQFNLGAVLRERYDSLLTPEYSPDIIFVRSTDDDPTLMSAQCNLAGMYPPRNAQVWNPDLEWQPIPVHSVPVEFDNMLKGTRPCPVYKEEYERVLKSKEIKKLNDSFRDVYAAMNKNSGGRYTNFEELHSFYRVIVMEEGYSLVSPKWVQSIKERLREASLNDFKLRTYNKKLARLKIGALVKDINENMKRKAKKGSRHLRNMNMYSSHDMTIGDLMNTLGVFDMIHPPLAACLMIELRVDSSGKHRVLMFYHNNTIGESYQLKLPKCSLSCPLKDWLKILDPVTVGDWYSECQKFPIGLVILIIMLAILIVLVLILIGVVIYWIKKKKRSRAARRENQVNNTESVPMTEQVPTRAAKPVNQVNNTESVPMTEQVATRAAKPVNQVNNTERVPMREQVPKTGV